MSQGKLHWAVEGMSSWEQYFLFSLFSTRLDRTMSTLCGTWQLLHSSKYLIKTYWPFRASLKSLYIYFWMMSPKFWERWSPQNLTTLLLRNVGPHAIQRDGNPYGPFLGFAGKTLRNMNISGLLFLCWFSDNSIPFQLNTLFYSNQSWYNYFCNWRSTPWAKTTPWPIPNWASHFSDAHWQRKSYILWQVKMHWVSSSAHLCHCTVPFGLRSRFYS